MEPRFNPEQILAVSRGFMESRILITGAELDLFTLLADEPMSAEQAAERTGYHLRPLVVILDALSALGFLVKKDERYQTDPDAQPFLRSDSPRSVLPMILHAGGIWANWSQLTGIVRETGGAPDRSAISRTPEALAAFIGAMHVVGAKLAPRMAAEIDPGPARRFLDVGGGSGTYVMAFLEASPTLRATLFDLPPVIEMAHSRLEAAGLISRVDLVAGDYNRDDLPPGHDLALLSAIIHQNSPDQNEALYRKIYKALEPGGRLVIRDHVMKPDRTAPKAGALFAVNMLAATPGGGTFTLAEIETGLRSAGFDHIRQLREGPAMDCLVEAIKPE